MIRTKYRNFMPFFERDGLFWGLFVAFFLVLSCDGSSVDEDPNIHKKGDPHLRAEDSAKKKDTEDIEETDNNKETGQKTAQREGKKNTDQNKVVLLLLGDSLTFGFMLGQPAKHAYPAIARNLLSAKGHSITLINDPSDPFNLFQQDRVKNYVEAVESHDITLINASAPAVRAEHGVSALLAARALYEEIQITHVLLALGANEGLKRVSVSKVRSDIDNMIREVKSLGMEPLLGGMKMFPPERFPQYQEYTPDFDAMFPDLSNKYDIPLWDFILKDVALKNEYNLVDGIHPNIEGHKIIGRYFASFLQKHLLKPI